MKRIITGSGLLVVFSFLFSGSSSALVLFAGDRSGIMPVTKKAPGAFFEKAPDPFWVEGGVRYAPILNLALAKNEPVKSEPVVLEDAADPEWPVWMEWLKGLRKVTRGNLSFLYTDDFEKTWNGIFNLAIKQFDSKATTAGRDGLKNGDYKGETREFAETLVQYFLKPPGDDAGYFERENIGPKTGVDEDHFIFEFENEQLILHLVKDIGRLNGLPWGISKIIRQPRVKGAGDTYELNFREDNKTVDYVKNKQTLRVFTKPQ